jgi:acid phosphatase family membrane protein YuiD
MYSYISITVFISLGAWFTAQALKVIGAVIRQKKLDLSYFVRSGGMPSAHTAMVTALATSIGVLEGFDSNIFAIAIVLAAIVMYDAAGVRRSVGKQSIILNRILQELKERRPRDIQNDVRELIGHTPLQVFFGGILGITIALIWLALSGYL